LECLAVVVLGQDPGDRGSELVDVPIGVMSPVVWIEA
jgi:hypothetical protein